jgi:hypothetical protein
VIFLETSRERPRNSVAPKNRFVSGAIRYFSFGNPSSPGEMATIEENQRLEGEKKQCQPKNDFLMGKKARFTKGSRQSTLISRKKRGPAVSPRRAGCGLPDVGKSSYDRSLKAIPAKRGLRCEEATAQIETISEHHHRIPGHRTTHQILFRMGARRSLETVLS